MYWLISKFVLFFPMWIWGSITVIGLIAYIATKFFNAVPFIAGYLIVIRTGAIAAMAVGIFMLGGSSIAKVWKEEVLEWQAKVIVAEGQSKALANQLEADRALFETANATLQAQLKGKIAKNANKMDSQCKVIPEVIDILNQAAKSK